MNIVNFEGLGIYLKLNKVAISLFGIDIYWYAIFIVIAFILAILLCKKNEGKYNIKFDDVLELLLFVIPISIISARLYFILFKLDYYIQNPNEILDIRNGGLAIYGGIIGAILTIVLFCKKKNINILDMCDYIAPYLPLGQAIGRWGNFFNSEAHGIETNSLFRMGIMEKGNYIQVHPTFLYESICTFIIFVILFAKKDKRKYAGQLTYIYFFLYGIIRAFIEGLRTDSLMLGNFKISQILSIILSIVCGSILIYKRIKNKNE
ncbi:MAG: prolipoprotein diacylglyceryl transferase [Clostridia bacterium]|nr:prolipoprotein diacylglyceryl transferase [Clostridia bacterium]